MKKLIISILFLICPVLVAAPSNTLINQNEIIKKLPGKLAKVEWKKQSPVEIQKAFGAPLEKETKDGFEYYYYSFDGIKYDTSVVFKDNKLSHVVFVPGNTKLTIKDFEDYFSGTELSDARKIANEKQAHEKGRVFNVENKEVATALVVAQNSKFTIRQIFLWTPGQVKP